MSDALDFITQKAEQLDQQLCDEAAEKMQMLNVETIDKMFRDKGVETSQLIIASTVIHVNQFIFDMIKDIIEQDPVEASRVALQYLPGSVYWDMIMFPMLVSIVKEL